MRILANSREILVDGLGNHADLEKEKTRGKHPISQCSKRELFRVISECIVKEIESYIFLIVLNTTVKAHCE